MTRETLDQDAWLGARRQLRERDGVDLVDHPQHGARLRFARLPVGAERDALERDAVAARVAVLTADAQREGELAHPPRQRLP